MQRKASSLWARCVYADPVPTQVIVLNGGSSSGKSSIARCLQALLPEPWLLTGCDTFVDALPPAMQKLEDGIEFAADGAVNIGEGFRKLEVAWMEGVAATVRAGGRVIIDDVFLVGASSQQRWQQALGGLKVLWVGVRCDSVVAAGREADRGDRATGMAALQADLVHTGVRYDLEVDTTDTASRMCAKSIVAHVD